MGPCPRGGRWRSGAVARACSGRASRRRADGRSDQTDDGRGERGRRWIMKALWILAGLVVFTGTLGCAPRRPPAQLKDAREAYQRASTVPGASEAATDLYEARQALDAAEAAYAKDGPKSNKTKNLAYIAHRKAISAMGK